MVAFGFPAIGIFMALRYHMQGVGITSPFAVASVIGFIANIPLNYMFIFGFGDIPAMGAQGCGVATAISMWLSALIITLYVLTKKSLQQYMPPLRPVAPDPATIKEILTLALRWVLRSSSETAVFAGIALLVCRWVMLPLEHTRSHSMSGTCFTFQCSLSALQWQPEWGMHWELRISRGSSAALKAGILCSGVISVTTMIILLSFPTTIVGIIRLSGYLVTCSSTAQFCCAVCDH